MTDKTVRFVIRRQATPQSEPFWEEFDLKMAAWHERHQRSNGHCHESGRPHRETDNPHCL